MPPIEGGVRISLSRRLRGAKPQTCPPPVGQSPLHALLVVCFCRPSHSLAHSTPFADILWKESGYIHTFPLRTLQMPRPKGTSTSRKPKTSKIIPKNASVTSTNTKRPIGGKAGAKKTATTEPPAKTSDIATSARKKHLGAVSEAEFDGGLFALAGYVNQMLGSAADLARCLSGKAAESGGFKTLLCFETEVHGQDSSAIGLTAEKHGIRVLKQYKYSSNPEKYPIRPKELREIAATLKQSEAKANTTKSLQTDLVLCTNRPVTAKAQATSDYKTLRLEPYHALKARAELESYAARFGVFNPDELHEGVRRAIDYLFEAATSASHRVTKSLFEEKLIGHKQPRSIAVAEAAFERRQELCRLATELLILAPASLAEREIINSATVDWMNDALIVFVGEGGCGKTTALWQLLWDAINTQPPQRLAQMMISQGQTSQSFGAVVERWRGIVSAANMPSDDLALERLKQANPAVAPPIVLLGLDGIDETPSPTWSDTAARVLSFFWSLHVRAKNDGIAPPARLFVSCRRESEVERLLPLPTGAGLTRAAPRYVHFGEFNSKELTDLVHHTPTLDPLAADRISKSLIDGFEVAETDSGPRPLYSNA